MPVSKDIVAAVANLITTDPEIVIEGFNYPPTGEYKATDVPLTPDETIVGDVFYAYSIKRSGDYAPATYHQPADIPTLEISNLDEVSVLAARDEMGRPVPPTPAYQTAAADYFWRHLAERLAQKTHEYY